VDPARNAFYSMKTHEDALKPNNTNTEEDQEEVTESFDEEAKKRSYFLQNYLLPTTNVWA
jgi:hypothetical protein